MSAPDRSSRLPHPLTGEPFPSPVPPGTGWPDDPAAPDTPVAATVADVVRLAATDDLAALDARVSVCSACPRLVAWREDVAREKRGVVRRPALLGAADRGLGRPGAPGADRRTRARGQRRQPHGPRLHR